MEQDVPRRSRTKSSRARALMASRAASAHRTSTSAQRVHRAATAPLASTRRAATTASVQRDTREGIALSTLMTALLVSYLLFRGLQQY